MYRFFLGRFSLHQVPRVLFQDFPLIIFPPLPSLYHHPPFISRVYHRLHFPLQSVTLNIFSLAFPPSSDKPSLGSLSDILPCTSWQHSPRAAPLALGASCTAQGHPEAPHGVVSLALPEVQHHHLLPPSPLDTLLTQKGRQKKWSVLFCAWKQFFGVLRLLCALK